MAHPATVIDGEEIARIVDAHSALEGPLLPMLHALQEAFGHVPAQAHAPICDALNITRAELHGVITFYHDFREKPAGRHVLKICRAEACQSVGGAAVADALLAKLGLEWHGTPSDGAVTIEPADAGDPNFYDFELTVGEAVDRRSGGIARAVYDLVKHLVGNARANVNFAF